MTNTTKCIYIQKSQPPQNTPFPCWTFTNTRSLSQTLRYTQIPTCCSVNSPSGRHCCWFDLENTFTPTPWSRTVAFGIEVLFWTHINHRKGRHHTWGHHMSQCTRQTPPTLLYSNEQLWMPFSYSDGIDTDVGFADITNASTGRTYHSRSFNTGSTDVKTSQNKGERTENTARPAYLRKAMTLLVHYYNWEFDTHNNVQSKKS